MLKYIAALCMISLGAGIQLNSGIKHPTLEAKIRQYPHNFIFMGMELWPELIRHFNINPDEASNGFKITDRGTDVVLERTRGDVVHVHILGGLSGDLICSGTFTNVHLSRLAALHLNWNHLVKDAWLNDNLMGLLQAANYPRESGVILSFLGAEDGGIAEDGHQIIKFRLVGPRNSGRMSIMVQNIDQTWNFGITDPIPLDLMPTQFMPADTYTRMPKFLENPVRTLSDKPFIGPGEFATHTDRPDSECALYSHTTVSAQESIAEPESREYNAERLYEVIIGDMLTFKPMQNIRITHDFVLPGHYSIVIGDELSKLLIETRMILIKNILKGSLHPHLAYTTNNVIPANDLASIFTYVFPEEYKITDVRIRDRGIDIMNNAVRIFTINRTNKGAIVNWIAPDIVGMPLGQFLHDLIMTPDKFIQSEWKT